MRLALALLTLIALATPTSAEVDAVETLSPIQTLSPNGAASFKPTVALDSNGNAVFAWTRYDYDEGGNTRIHMRVRSDDGVLSNVRTLSSPLSGSFNPRVAVDAAGNALIVWSRTGCSRCFTSRLEARVRSAGGVLSRVQAISQKALSPAFAVSRSGNAVFAWSRFDGLNWRIEARARSVDGVLSPVQTLSPPHKNAFGARIGVDYHGNAVIVWEHSDGTHERVWARALSADGALTPIRAISPAGKSAGSPDVAVSPSGHAIVAWQQPADEPQGNGGIWVRARDVDGTLSPVQMISAFSVRAADFRVAVDADGNAVVMWHVEERMANGESRDFIQARGRSVSGTLSAVQFVTDSNENTLIGSSRNGQVAVDAAGNAVFTWERFNGTLWRIQTRARSADGVLSDVQTLSAPGADAYFPEVATNDSGNAVFIWAQSDGSTRARARSAP